MCPDPFCHRQCMRIAAVSAGLPDMLRRIPNTEPYGIYPVFLNEIQRIHNSSVKVLHLYSGIFQLRYKR